MKKLLLALIALASTSTVALAQSFNVNSNSLSSTTSFSYDVNNSTTNVSGYTRSNGTYVDSYTRTMPNSTNHDNFSTYGNVNPYTETVGSRARDYSTESYNYGAGHTIQTGPRGGQYYINDKGNKVYVPKR